MGSRLPSQVVFLVVATGLTSAVAFVSWHAYERHFLALKRFFPQTRPARGCGAVAGVVPEQATRDPSGAFL